MTPVKQATNATTMRASNRKLILNLIRLQPISRVELAEKVHLTRASITQIVDELLEAGLVEAVAVEQRNSIGRKRTQLALCHNARFMFGVNIRRSHCHVGIVDLYGDVLARHDIFFNGRSATEVIDAVADTMLRQLSELGLPRDKVIGAGVAAPGPVDYNRGIILNPPNFESWHGVDVCARITERTGLNAVIEKDTNARALEEKYFGVARSISNFLLVQIDDGVGSGAMIRDRLFRGTNGYGTEIGHTSINFDGPVCSCGGRGCLENYLMTPALLNNSPYRSWEALTDAEGEPQADALLDAAAHYLATALISAFNMFDLENVILTGDVALSPEPLLRRVNALIMRGSLNRTRLGSTPVVASKAGSPVRTGAMAGLYDMFESR